MITTLPELRAAATADIRYLRALVAYVERHGATVRNSVHMFDPYSTEHLLAREDAMRAAYDMARQTSEAEVIAEVIDLALVLHPNLR